jgi:subtilisin
MRNKSLVILAAVAVLALLFLSCSNDKLVSSPEEEYLTKAPSPPIDKAEVLIGINSTAAADAIMSAGGEILTRYEHFPVVYAWVPKTSLVLLEKNPGIAYVEPNIEYEHLVQTLDWGVDRIDAEYVADSSSYTGAGIDVAIIDSGGDQDHPDLTWAGGRNFYGYNINAWDDRYGHGTHVAGIISADNNTIGVVGVAPSADVWALRVGNSSLYLNAILSALSWCIDTQSDGDPDNDIKIISMSWGSTSNSTSIASALQTCYNDGMLLVAAAGNTGTQTVLYPAALSYVMAISASTSSDLKASFSSYGSAIELIAPGAYIYSTYRYGGYATMSGTSMACPMVSGTAALAWEANPTYTNAQIRSLLQNTAEDIGLSSYYMGYGLVDAENATLGTTYGDN